MKKLFYFLALFLASFLYSQKYVDAVIIKNNNDTVKAKMKISVNFVNSDFITESSFMRTAHLTDDNGNKLEKINAQDIKKLSFVYNGKTRNYENDGKQLKEAKYIGKIKWYRTFSQHLYDGSMQYDDYLVGEDGKIYKLGSFGRI